jgi:tRNA U34 5-carboxymethylaminomethyl modifying enzyme MnmG/GidA
MSFTAAPTESFDVIVVGGGHAGCEAAITTARLGLNTAFVQPQSRSHRLAALQPGRRRTRQKPARP